MRGTVMDLEAGFSVGGVFFMGYFIFCVGFFFFVWVRAGSLGFRSLGFSAGFGFLVFRFLGFLATRLLIAFLPCMACWLLGFLGFSASRLVSTFYRFVYYIILCYNKFHEYIYIYIYMYNMLTPPR